MRGAAADVSADGKGRIGVLSCGEIGVGGGAWVPWDVKVLKGASEAHSSMSS